MRAKEITPSGETKERFVEMFGRFLPLAMHHIRIKRLPNIVFQGSINDDEQPTFGKYVTSENTLYVALSNRHPVDILRTIAHELQHYKQDTEHRLEQDSGRTGSPEENEAHAVAGIVMRHFNRKYPEYLKIKPLVVENNIEERKRKKIRHAAYGPGPYGWYGYDAGYSGDSGSDGGAAESAGDRGDIPTGPGEQLIPFPQGTVMIDVSDVYDWYKLGMVISDLDDADPKIFGKGAPHTAIAFGSEEEEHKLLPLLKRLGLSVHDIDRPEDVKQAIPAKMFARDLAETIRKIGSQYRLISKSGKNLGTYPSKAGAEKRERQVQYFKHVGESLITESKSAPLYHFTSFNKLIKIIYTDQLFSPSGKIYFTRDYQRQFLPHEKELLDQPYGLRINQELLARDYGGKLQAGGQDTGWDEKKRQAWMADPKNAQDIERVKQTGQGSGLSYNGVNPQDIVRGSIGQARRWESEEHLNVKSLPDLHKYITGIVIGKPPLGQTHFVQEKDPDPLTKIADVLIHMFGGKKGFDQRNMLLDIAVKLGVPLVYERKDFDAAQVKKRIIQLYSQRKKEREEEQSKPQQSFLVITSTAGGGIVTGGSDINSVLKKLSQDPKWRDRKIYGYSIGLSQSAEKKMFDTPKLPGDLVGSPELQKVAENFADGRNPQDKGDSARHGIKKGMSIAQLKKIRSSKTASPRKKQLAHWQINMRQGKSKS